jgi:hypothetical protein
LKPAAATAAVPPKKCRRESDDFPNGPITLLLTKTGKRQFERELSTIQQSRFACIAHNDVAAPAQSRPNTRQVAEKKRQTAKKRSACVVKSVRLMAPFCAGDLPGAPFEFCSG